MSKERILARLLAFHDLPTLPQVIVRVIETLRDERSSAKDLSDLLEKDHAISARVLRLANSAFFGLAQRVGTIRRAVIVLGFDAVRQLALASSVFNTFAKRRQFAFNPEDFWMHSLGAAVAAQTLSAKRCRVESPEACFTAGLLHDIGKYILALVLKDEYVALVNEARDSQSALRDLELEQLGLNHAEVGEWIVAKWQFPPLFKDVLGNLHRVSRYAGPYRTEAAVVCLANSLSIQAGFGLVGDGAESQVEQACLDIVGLKGQAIDEVRQEVESYRDEASQFLSLLDVQ